MAEFEEKVKKFNRFYLCLVIAVASVSVAAIITAMYINIMAGVIIGICGVLAYLLLLSDEMKRSLGIWYRRIEGGLSVWVIEPKKKDCVSSERYIPQKIMWLDVVSLSAPEGKDRPDTTATTLYIPPSVKRIEKDALSSMTSLVCIKYLGSSEEWAQVICEAELDGINIVCETHNEEQENNENEIL